MARNLKSYFSKKVSQPSTSDEDGMPTVPDAVPVQDGGLEREQDSDHDSDSSDAITSLHPDQGCSCQCCSIPETPYQPSDVSDSKVRHAHHSKDRSMGQKKCYDRKIQPN